MLYVTKINNLQIHEDNSRISIQTEHKDIEIHINYRINRNKKWVTNFKGGPHFCYLSSSAVPKPTIPTIFTIMVRGFMLHDDLLSIRTN